MKDEKKMLGGWRKATLVLGVLVLLLGAASALLLQNVDAVVECIAGALGLFLISGVLAWMGEVESHLRAIRGNAATSADRLARMERMMDAGAQTGAKNTAAPQQAEAHESKPEKPEKMDMEDAMRIARKLTR